MRRLFTLFAACALLLAQEDPTFRAAISLVHVDAEVIDQEGRIIPGLTRGDFRVFDDGKQQTIVDFAAEDQPLDLILLFDVSGSMKAVVETVSASAEQAFRELRPDDRISVMAFNSRSRVLLPFTEDLEEVRRTIRERVVEGRFGGGTRIQDAVDDAALRFLHDKRTQRRAVLIVTDNMGQRTRREESVVRDFWEADALLSGLIVANPKFQAMHTVSVILGPQSLLMQAGMKGIARKTGGDAIRAEDPSTAFPDAIHRIRTRYSLYHALPAAKPGVRRTLHVELSPAAAKRFPKSNIHARAAYIVPAG